MRMAIKYLEIIFLDDLKHLNEDELPVFTSDNIQVLEGEFECEKVWQYFWKDWNLSGGIDSGWIDFDGEEELLNETRQIYKVILPVKEEAETLTEVRQAAIDKMMSISLQYDGENDFIMGFEFGANYDRKQTIDKVVELIQKCWDSDENFDAETICTKIKELK